MHTENRNHAISAAFAVLRKQGFLAKQNVACCMTCALAELQQTADARRKPVKGLIYYHGQDAERRNNGEEFHIRFSEVDDSPVPSDVVGLHAYRALNEAGVHCTWNGEPGQAITILAEGAS